ncbi:MAG: NAD-dependent epimerase/dehydratase family protein [Oribacterium sp.]|nr:NAD-dependent epimerase/dehydratase family protein [Oribacterium sp.]
MSVKKVLILGKDSYIGEHIYSWLKKYPDQYDVSIVSTMNYEWKNADWSNVDSIVDLAGIAHINNITEEMRPLFYSVNRDLTGEIGKWSKEHGVPQMIYFSSMNVYGDYCQHITDNKAENPTSFYGDSKLQGDNLLRKLEDDSFKVAHVRPPFVYGKGCKGNYNTISNIAKKTPIFPTYRNKKSMIYIDNLCEFVRLLIDSGEGGIYTPQNKELVSTADLVKAVSKVVHHKVIFTPIFNWAIPIGNKMTRAVRRGFADDCYDMKLSDYWNFKYCVVDFKESINKTEN